MKKTASTFGALSSAHRATVQFFLIHQPKKLYKASGQADNGECPTPSAPPSANRNRLEISGSITC
jgi:hypothetical protein